MADMIPVYTVFHVNLQDGIINGRGSTDLIWVVPKVAFSLAAAD